ncbi:MAG: Ig-like domain-containing protein [Muribaculaceae bacterium]|nr:Ig-like domain-containing protein [Muribaculaceae bacterium]
MKHLYSLITLAAATLTATAATPTASTDFISLSKPTKVQTVNKIDVKSATSLKKAVKKHAPEAKEITSIEDIEGVWSWDFSPLLQNMTSPKQVTINVSNAETGEVEIIGIAPAGTGYKVKGTFDMEAGTLTIPNGQYLGEYDPGYLDYFYIKAIDWNAGEIVDGKADVEATVGELSEGAIIFPDDDVWAVGNPDSEDDGYWALSYMNEFDVIEPEEPVDPMEGWEVYCTGKMQDGWIYPAYGIDPVGKDFAVEIHRSIETPGLYRVFNPYKSEGFQYNSEAQDNGMIVFNITDPEFVQVLPAIKSGIMNGSQAINNTNVEGYWMAQDYDKATIISALGESIPAWSTFENNIVTIPTARIQLDSDGCYTWSSNGTSLADLMVSKIIFDKTPVEYVATGISFVESEVTIKEGETVTLTPTFEPAHAAAPELTWTSTNEEVATVSSTGVVTAVAAGEATIVVTSGELSAECKVVVYAKPVLTFGVMVPVNETVTLSVSIENALQTDEAPTWTSSDTTIATVSEGGSVTGVEAGTADITATYAGESATITITVVDEQNVLINELTAAKASKKYDLQGRVAAKNAKGVIIVTDGKKAEKTIVK